MTVFITTTQDVIFVITYPIVFLVPVRLQLLYHEEDDEGKEVMRSQMFTPSTEYTNTSVINYIAFDSLVPFNRFRVEISLVHQSVIGPGRETPVFGE